MASEINEKTKVELYALLVAVPVVAAYILWMTTMYTTAVNAEKVNEAQDARFEKFEDSEKKKDELMLDKLNDIDKRTIRIEVLMKGR